MHCQSFLPRATPSIGYPARRFLYHSNSSYLRFDSYLNRASGNPHFNPKPEAMGKEEKSTHFYSHKHTNSDCKCIFSSLLSFFSCFPTGAMFELIQRAYLNSSLDKKQVPS